MKAELKPNLDGKIRDILGARFRSNNEFELVAMERLTSGQKKAWPEVARDLAAFGVLLPREGTPWRPKSVCRDTALLYFAMAAAGPLPGFARGPDAEESARAIAALVLDGILEIEANGRFVTGPAAAATVLGESAAGAETVPLARLSSSAIAYGAGLDGLDAARLAARMYFYNRIPLTPVWRRLFPTDESVRARLGLSELAALRSWRETPADSANPGWISWMPRSGGGARRTYKLYVSPKPPHVREAFEALVGAASANNALGFKCGRNSGGLLRPDKFVGYFASYRDVERAAAHVERELGGCPAQGVPFSAPFGESLLVSWGMDPPAASSGERRESWRLFLTRRLAVHLQAAQSASAEDAVRFALERMRLEQIDPATWTPAAELWRAASN